MGEVTPRRNEDCSSRRWQPRITEDLKEGKRNPATGRVSRQYNVGWVYRAMQCILGWLDEEEIYCHGWISVRSIVYLGLHAASAS